MLEVWKIDPNCWNVDKDGKYTGPVLVRLVSRHRKAARALAVVESARDLEAFDSDGKQIAYYTLCNLALEEG